MMATGSASYKNGDSPKGNVFGYMGAGLPLDEAAGYGGDIYGVIGTNPIINNGDYLSDLDIVNILEVRGDTTNIIEVISGYYFDITQGNMNRADEFAINKGKGNREEGIKYLEKQLNGIKITDKHYFRDREYVVAESFISHIKNSQVQW